MARHNKYDLLELLVQAVKDTGWNVLYLETIDEHPFNLQLYRDDASYKIRVYIWNLTHGGGQARPKNEYRIQITGTNHFDINKGEKTLVLGWWKELGIFAGFDVRKHLGKLGYSPSIQIREEALRDAYINGFAPCDKGNGEVAIAFRPDFIIEYIHNLEPLHDFGQSPKDLTVLEEVARLPEINDEDIQIQDVNRKETVITISKKLRDINFKKRVLTVYTFSCAVCGIQLKLVEAAHIIPVNHHNSTDETRNGLALCGIHHKAYDQGFITVSDEYKILLNDKQINEYKKLKLAEGLDNFTNNLRPLILLPHAVSDRPHKEYIRIANMARGWG